MKKLLLASFFMISFLFSQPSDTETILVPLYSYPYGGYEQSGTSWHPSHRIKK